MAGLYEGIFGPVSGKLGPIIGGTWKGIPYIRIVSDKILKPRTPGQIANQEKFNYVNQLLVPFHPYINVGFTNEAVRKTEISAAFSIAFHNAIIGTFPTLSVDYSKLMLSAGPLPMLEEVTMELLTEDTLKLNWRNESLKTAFNDQVMLVVYCPELHRTDGFVGGVDRSKKECIFKFGENFIGKTLEIYVSVTSIDRKRIADSQYLGSVDPNQRRYVQLSMF